MAIPEPAKAAAPARSNLALRVVSSLVLAPLALIVACTPDVLVKGGDYTIDTTVGAAEVRARGGRFVAIPFTFDRSTTALLNRIRH